MYIFTPQNTSSTRITVTGTSAPLYALMDTAGSILTSESYYQAAKANALLIRPEDGDIRVFSKATPTSTLGTLLKNGTMYYFAGVDFTNFNLIRTSGSVACSIQLGLALAGESSFAASVDALSVSLDEFPAAAALTDNFANPTTTSVAAMNMIWDGATWDRMPGTSTAGVQIIGSDATNNAVAAIHKTISGTTYAPTSVQIIGTVAASAGKNATGNILSCYAMNTNAAVRYLQIHNKASIPLSTEVPAFSFPIPIGSSIIIGEDFFTKNGVNLTLGVAAAISTTFLTYTAATANEHVWSFQYV